MNNSDIEVVINTIYSATDTDLLGVSKLSQDVIDEIVRRDNAITPKTVLELRLLAHMGFPLSLISSTSIVQGISITDLDHLLSIIVCDDPWGIVGNNSSRCSTSDDVKRMKDIVTYLHTVVTPIDNTYLHHIARCECVELTKYAFVLMTRSDSILDRESILSVTYTVGNKNDYVWTMTEWMLPMIGGVAALTVDDRRILIARILLTPIANNHNYDRLVQELMGDNLVLGEDVWMTIVCNNDKSWIMRVMRKYKGRYRINVILGVVLTHYDIHVSTGHLGSLLRYIVSKGGDSSLIQDTIDRLPGNDIARGVMLSVLENDV